MPTSKILLACSLFAIGQTFGWFHLNSQFVWEWWKNKPFLAFDLMEEFRSPIVDSFVLKLVNSSVVKPKDFESVITTGGVYLKTI